MPAISQWPVVVSLPGERQRAAAERSGRLGGGRQSFERLDVAESQAAQIRQAQRAAARDVAERVAAGIAVCRGVRHLADAHAVEHDPDHAAEHKLNVASFETRARQRGCAYHAGRDRLRVCHQVSSFGSGPVRACAAANLGLGPFGDGFQAALAGEQEVLESVPGVH